jgi:hypothetical protein
MAIAIFCNGSVMAPQWQNRYIQKAVAMAFFVIENTD